MIVRVDYPGWGRCTHNLAPPPPSDPELFHSDGCVWALWRNAHAHAYAHAMPLKGMGGYQWLGDGFPTVTRYVLADTGCI